MNGSRRTTWPPSFRLLITVQGGILVVAALHYGEPVLLPLTMTVLLTFLLRPAVLWLERRHLRRAVAVGIVVLAIATLIGSALWGVTVQFRELALHLDEYRGHLRGKINALHRTRIQSFENLRLLLHEVADAVDPTGASPPAERAVGSAASQHSDRDADRPANTDDLLSHSGQFAPSPLNGLAQSESLWTAVKLVWSALTTPLTAMIVIAVLVIFALAEYEELRNRVYRLAGHNRLTLTTRALDEAGQRISRYLAAYALVNCGFGAVVFLGLSLLGVHFALLWGFLAGAWRFLPYVGAIAGAGLPICMAIIQFPDWTHPGLVAAMFLVLEILTNSFIEPVTYGKSAGVSAIALLISALFWAWIWGPMGLMLSVPLTVVLAVVGRHVPQFEVLGILLADGPALAPHVSFYQRLIAGDIQEVSTTLNECRAAHGMLQAYDQLLVPALALAERDGRQGALEPSDFDSLWKNAAELVDDCAPSDSTSAGHNVRVVGCAARNAADELALVMLQQLVAAECELRLFGSHAMASEEISAIADNGAHAVIISDLGSGADLHDRYLCKRIRRVLPRVKIIVGRWGYTGDTEALLADLRDRGADEVVTTLSKALDSISRIQPIPFASQEVRPESQPAIGDK